MIKGRVTKSTGSWYLIKTEEGKLINGRMTGKFRLHGMKLTNPVAVGDFVSVELEDDGETGVVKEILPRKNYVVRQSPRKKHHLHLLASNVDQAMLIITVVEPKLKPGFIDRFLLMTEPYDIPTHIVFNKADLYSQGDLNIFGYLKDVYEYIGYQVHLVSSKDKSGIDQLKDQLKGKYTLIGGQSGVGKSTLVNAVLPGLTLRTQDLSGYTGKGQHTTTFAEMHYLEGGGAVIDTPGIKTLSFNHLSPQDVAHNFKEFFRASENCKFGGNCLHRNEPGCAVKEALEAEVFSPLRYENYLTLLDEIEEINYWERNKKF